MPTRPVTVVMPYYEAPDALRLTLAAFAAQTYPHELLQVLVVDDGSTPPLELPDDPDLGDLRVDVVHQEDRGFGLARARNTGAKVAEGEILLFVDCDMVPEPWHVEAHARWHHVTSDAVVLGFRRHVEFGGVTPEQLRGADPAVGLAPLFAERDVQVPTWIDAHMERTDHLRTVDDDLFRPVTGGNLSMRADTYWRVGGSDESFTQWGAEDTELGFRVFVDGELLVPDREARCWHQGHGHAPTESEKASLDDQRAKLAHLIAQRGFRSGHAGRHFQVPRVVARVTVGSSHDRQQVMDTVESLLGGRFTDLAVVVEVDPAHPDATWLHRQFDPDPQVHLFDRADLDELAPHTPVRLSCEAGIVLQDRALGRLVQMLESGESPSGRLRVTVPAVGPGAPTELLELHLTRAERRARRAATAGEDVDPLLAELFGERWVSADEVGVEGPATGGPEAEPAAEDDHDRPAPPPAPRVHGNQWDELEDVPALARWTPQRTVSVVMPHYQAVDALAITLTAFAKQTYPMDLFEVVVVDDGSSPPLQLPDDLDLGDLQVRVLHQEDRGFGAPRARNLGARHARGEIVVFVDCDMVPEPWMVEAHARWHHTASDLVVLGFRKHVAFDAVTPADVATMDPAVGVAALVGDRAVEVPEWIEGHMLRTDMLTSSDRDLFRPVASGNLSVRAEEFWRVGGFDESFTQWGGEDTELGYRLFTDGAVLVPDREAMCWHQGAGHEPSETEWQSLEDQRAKLAHLIADRGFRSSQPGRRFTVPRIAIRVPVDAGTGRQAVLATVESILAGTFNDVLVVVQIPDDHPDRTWLDRQFDPDPKVVLRGPGTLGSLDAEARHAPMRGTVDPGIVLGDDTLRLLVATLESTEDPVGVAHVTVPGRAPDDPDGMIQLWLTRAHRRALRTAREGEAHAALAGELFGERWLPGTDLGVHDREIDPPQVTAAPTANASAASLDEVSDLWQVFRNLDPGRARRHPQQCEGGTGDPGATRASPAGEARAAGHDARLGTAPRVAARTPGDVARGLVQVAHAVLPWAVYRALRQLGQPVARRLRRPS